MPLDYENICSDYTKEVDTGLAAIFHEEEEQWRKDRTEDRDIIKVHPHSSSLILPLTASYTQLVGNCHRETFFSAHDVTRSNPPTPEAMRRMDIGKLIEKREHEYINRSSKHEVIQHNLRLKTPLIHDALISGEMDSVMRDQLKRIYILEVKSFYGYQAHANIFGNTKIVAAPKLQHLAQTFIYFYMLEASGIKIEYCLIHYIDRSDLKQKPFLVEVHKTDDDAYPIVNGRPYSDFTLSRLISRYMSLALALKERRLPPRDGQLMYTERKINDLHEAGLVPKSKFAKWQKGEAIIGDYQCSWCYWRNLCWGNNPRHEETHPDDASIVSTITTGTIRQVIEGENTEDDGWGG